MNHHRWNQEINIKYQPRSLNSTRALEPCFMCMTASLAAWAEAIPNGKNGGPHHNFRHTQHATMVSYAKACSQRPCLHVLDMFHAMCMVNKVFAKFSLLTCKNVHNKMHVN